MNILRILREPGRRWLEHQYADHYGWNLDLMRGRAEVEPGWSDRYRIEGPISRLRLPDRPVDRILMGEPGRFGNRVIQLKNVMRVAEKIGVPVVQASQLHELFTPLPDNKIILSSRGDEHSVGGHEVVLEGSFYCQPPLNIHLSPADHADLTRRYVRPLIRPIVLSPDPRAGPNDMALHFRAGDIMTGHTIHCEYGQPPVSFYLKAAEHSRADRFWLVYEDLSNPAVKVVEQYLREKGHDVILQSGSLEEDCRLILSISHLAAATGTFGYALAEISNKLRTLYSFSEFSYSPLAAFEDTAVQVVRIKDGEGRYNAAIMSKNWTASQAQLEMLLTYPQDHLKIA